jgi:hypothetical protein
MVQTADLQTECIKQSLRINVEMLFEWHCEDYQWTTSENSHSIPTVLCFITKYFAITSPAIQFLYLISLDIIHHPSFLNKTTFQRLALSPSSGDKKGRARGRWSYQMGPLDRANLHHWTNTKSSTGKTKSRYCNHTVEGLLHVANGRDKTLQYVWFTIPAMQIHQLDWKLFEHWWQGYAVPGPAHILPWQWTVMSLVMWNNCPHIW